MSFNHEPLESLRHIRVLGIQPSTDDAAIPCVTLRQVSLEDRRTAKSYDALSYVWGSRAPNVPIICDGRPLLVTENCRSALVQLRRRHSSRVSRALWIDAICIDQRNEEHAELERNSQVRQMGEVYGKARRVLVWLGNGGADSSLFYKKLRPAVRMQTLHSVFEISEVVGRSMILPKLHTMMVNASGKGASGLRALSNEEMTDEERNVMTEFVQNPWFRRVWTLQEVAFSRDAILLWGRARVTLGSLLWYAITVLFLGGTLKAQCVPGLKETLENLIRRNATALMIDYYKMPEWGRALVRIVLLGGSVIKGLDNSFLEQLEIHQATLEQDKVFGLFSSLKMSGIELPSPDYRKPASTVYEETTLAWIRSRQTLRILLFTDGMHEELPSWVFDWYQKPSSSRSHQYELGKLLRFDPLYARNAPRASTDSRTGALLNYQPGMLPVRGLFLGRVSSTATYTTSNFADKIAATSRWIDSLDTSTTAIDPHVAFHQILEPVVLGHAGVLGFDISKAVYKVSIKGPQNEFKSWLAGVSAKSSAATVTGTSAFVIQRMMRLVPFTLFALDSGYFGIGSERCLEGDSVYLLAGSPWPMVLRDADQKEDAKNETYRYIASVRIQGVMRGEVWPSNESSLKHMYLV